MRALRLRTLPRRLRLVCANTAAIACCVGCSHIVINVRYALQLRAVRAQRVPLPSDGDHGALRCLEGCDALVKTSDINVAVGEKAGLPTSISPASMRAGNASKE